MTTNPPATVPSLDADHLERTLRERVKGEVRFDDGSRALYASDASNYRQVPIGVVLPKSIEDVIATVAACREHGAPITSRGGGTSLCGQTCNVAVIMDFVVLEPACLSVFKEELPMMLPHDEQAKRLRLQSLLLPDFLAMHAPHMEWKPLGREALVHAHCHHKSVLGFGAEKSLLGRIGLDVHEPDSGCCGMAGSFGFERGAKYDVSMQCGERKLLPAVRGADAGALVIADGYSCREQIVQTTGHAVHHVAQVLRMALPPHGEGA